MKKPFVIALSGLLVLAMYAATHAFPQFKAEFDAMYVKEGTPLAAKVAEVKCNVCHEGTSKKMRNVYGQALDKLLDKDDMKDPDKIRAALKTVEAMKVDPKNSSSPTFGELIKAGKLPAGE
jgi:hypothetical protein